MIVVTLLGSGGGMPMPNRYLSSMLIDYQSRKILIDCGEGTQVSMRENKTGFKTLDIICLTHFHGDHIYGLPGLLSTMGNSGRTESLTIIGPSGVNKIIQALRQTIPYLPFGVDIIENPQAPLSLYPDPASGGLKLNHGSAEAKGKVEIILSTLKLHHSSPCLGYSLYIPRRPRFYPDRAIQQGIPVRYWKRLQQGETVVDGKHIYEPHMVLGEERRGIKLSYITDTRPIDTIPTFICQSDLLVCEGTYGADEDQEKALKNKHMTYREAAELALKGKVKELWLTHFSPAMDDPEFYLKNATGLFPNTILGHDGITNILRYSPARTS